MAIYDYECKKCGIVKEVIQVHDLDERPFDCECGGTFSRIFPQTPPSFELKYNNKTDMVDWEGNTSRYWDDYKKQKSEGKNVRIPEEDGQTR